MMFGVTFSTCDSCHTAWLLPFNKMQCGKLCSHAPMWLQPRRSLTVQHMSHLPLTAPARVMCDSAAYSGRLPPSPPYMQ
jgi:hypothetical protein